jgi:hypothetical protein
MKLDKFKNFLIRFIDLNIIQIKMEKNQTMLDEITDLAKIYSEIPYKLIVKFS